ncbi:MAG: magnesium transporter [Thermodesulfobacteriota bacterium]|nr:magnesium transporter [Thermodesulfobacteriota bacterium]
MPVRAFDLKVLKKYILNGWEFHVIEMLHDLKPVEIAALIETLDEDTRGKLFLLLDVDTASEVISELSDDSRDDVLDDITDKDLAKIVDDMDSDDATDLVGDLGKSRAERVLSAMGDQESDLIRSLLEYPEDSAGGIMQRELVSVSHNATIDHAITSIRQQHSEIDDIHSVFVVDENNGLAGTLPLVSLVLAKPDTLVSQVMEVEPMSIPVNMDQEEVARVFKQYDSVVMPVVDNHGMLIGRITVDDIMDIMEEEATEDMFLMAGAEEDLLSSSILKNVWSRSPWLLVCWIGGVLTTFLIQGFEPVLSRLVGLAAFMPVIMGMGGNVGAQSVTLVVRGLATGIVPTTHLTRIIFKQLGVGLMLGTLYGILLGGVAFIMYPEDFRMGSIVCLSIINSMVLASMVGTALPILFFKLGKDPAVASAPLVTTTIDLLGVSAYFCIAAILLF